MDRTVDVGIESHQCKTSKTPKNKHKNLSDYKSSSTTHVDRAELVSLNGALRRPVTPTHTCARIESVGVTGRRNAPNAACKDEHEYDVLILSGIV